MAMVAAMAAPRSIILMVPAGKPVDDRLAALAPILGPDDLVIDAPHLELIAENPDTAWNPEPPTMEG